MNKWLVGIMVLMFIWLGKLSWDFHQLSTKQLANINIQMSQQSQQMGRLNDEFVALQNHVKNTTPAQANAANGVANTQTLYSANDYYTDRITLTQLAVDQQQFNLALEYIQQLRQRLADDAMLSDTLQEALLLALVRDQASIVTYLQQRAEHLQLLQQQMNTLDTLLIPQTLNNTEAKWDLSHWFSLEKAESNETPNLMQRDLFYQKLELKLLLAQQALLAGQIKFYKQEISEILALIDLQPDDHAKKIGLQLRKIQQINLAGVPQLSSLTLMRKI